MQFFSRSVFLQPHGTYQGMHLKLLNEDTRPEARAWINMMEDFNSSCMEQAIVGYPLFQVGRHLWSRVDYLFSSQDVQIRIGGMHSNPQNCIILTEQDWAAFLPKQHLLLSLIQILEESYHSHVLNTFLSTNPEVRKLPDSWAQNSVAYQIELSDHFCAQIVHDEPFVQFDGWHTVQWGVMLRHKVKSRLKINSRASSSVYRDCCFFHSGEYDYFSRYLVQKLDKSVKMWGNLRKNDENVLRASGGPSADRVRAISAAEALLANMRTRRRRERRHRARARARMQY